MAGYGFIPAYHLMGGTIRMREYTIATGLAENIFTGDVVNLVAAGVLEPNAAGEDDMIGVFGGVHYVDASGNQIFSRYWPSATTATAIKAYVWDDPHIVWRVQSDQVGTAMTAAFIGTNGQLDSTAGSTVTGQSGFVMDSSDMNTQNTTPAEEQFTLLGSAEVDGSFTAAGTTMDVYVRFNQHLLLGGSLAAPAGV